jgi:hypothetical protein
MRLARDADDRIARLILPCHDCTRCSMVAAYHKAPTLSTARFLRQFAQPPSSNDEAQFDAPIATFGRLRR